MAIPDWMLPILGIAILVFGFAIPMSRIEARARDRGYAWFVATAMVALVLASWPGYWLASWIVDQLSAEQPSEANR